MTGSAAVVLQRLAVRTAVTLIVDSETPSAALATVRDLAPTAAGTLCLLAGLAARAGLGVNLATGAALADPLVALLAALALARDSSTDVAALARVGVTIVTTLAVCGQ